VLRLCLLFLWLSAAPAAFGGGCRFEYDPISVSAYYRAEGWALPGIADFNPSARPQLSELPAVKPIPGAKAEVLFHEYPYIVEFPVQDFVLNGSRQRMRLAQVKASIVRWKVDGHIVAYSYGLIPVRARKVHGKWNVLSELGCIFTATFIDDKGDGVFRVLVPEELTADLIPQWAKPDKS
jgi:hypothetical protein